MVVLKGGYGVMFIAHDTYATCDVLHSWCDVFDGVGVMTYTVAVTADRMVFNSDIQLVLSYKQCLWHHI